jgi:hypothetical protein
MRIITLLFISLSLFAKAPKDVNLKNPPRRIIRTCCSFGVNVKVVGVPFIKYTEVTSPELIGAHKYLGNKAENNGIIYTHKGGFIDMGHLRDIADFTAFLYLYIQKERQKGVFSLKLGNEGGMKTLNFNMPENLTDEDVVYLAGKIAYDLSVWHEISTSYGASFIPLLPERYSSFSVEDAYSNLLGVHLGMQSILSDGEYEMEMTKNVRVTLGNLDAVRDWGYAKEYVEAMWLMLQQPKGDDFVIATGESATVRQFAEVAFKKANLNWEDHVKLDKRYLRPSEVDSLVGDASKAEKILSWKAKTNWKKLAELMVDADIQLLDDKLSGRKIDD